MSEDIRDRMTGYRADATDGDGDGMIQDATPFERPEGTDLTEEQVALIEETDLTAKDVIDAKATGGSDEESVLAPVEDGVIGSTSKKRTAKTTTKKATVKKVEQAAVHADRNISWMGVGRIKKGYNFVDVDLADKWATLEGVRLVDADEIRELS